MIIKESFTFNDVLLVPKYSDISQRSDVDLSVSLSSDLKYSFPLIPANMANVTEEAMAIRWAKLGGLALIHRFREFDWQLQLASHLKSLGYLNNVGFSIGVKESDFENTKKLVEAGVRIICIDIAHGDSEQCVHMCKRIFSSFPFPKVHLIAGNVATASGAERLWVAGATTIKCGIGAGAICTTRIETGNGVPQLSALAEIAEVRNQLQSRTTHKKLTFIADGGITRAGDCVKALCFADMVMAGNVFAGSTETPGDIINIDGIAYKEYNGSSTLKNNRIEGVRSLVPFKGPVEPILQKFIEGIQSGCSYQGVNNLNDLKTDPQFVRVTQASLIESHPHDVKVVK